MLGWALRWPKLTLLIALATFVGSFALPKYIGFEFVPQADLGEQVVSIETPVGSSLEYTEAKLRQVDAALREFPEIEYTYGTVNTGYANGKNQASLYLKLKPLKERKRSPDQLAQPIRERLASIPGILVSINIPGGPGGGVQKQLQLSLQGPDTNVLDTISQDVMKRAAGIRGLVDLDRNLKAAKPILSVRLRRDAASDLGLGLAAVAQSLRPLFAGDETSLWRAPDGENYMVMVRLPTDDRTGIADLHRIWFTAGTEANGLPRMVHIAQIADVVTDVGASQINRRDLNREVQITANVFGRSAGEVSGDLQKILTEIKLPPGYRFVFGGSTKDMAESAAYAGQALLMAVILIYLILASQFGSFLQPIAIMMSLPMSLIGVFLGLLIAGTTLNIFSAIGFIMLMGLVTKNAILLVDFFNQARERGTPVNEALLEAGSIRLRPILMTTLAMVFGMMPLALGIGEGATQRAPMAHAVIGGLISSTLLTLVVVPVMLIYIDRISLWATRALQPLARRDRTRTQACRVETAVPIGHCAGTIRAMLWACRMMPPQSVCASSTRSPQSTPPSGMPVHLRRDRRAVPFSATRFLKALEDSKSVGRRTGWQPQYLLAESDDGTLQGAAPLYVKSHSQGEYVFDHGWAQALERAGWPLLSRSSRSPCPSRRCPARACSPAPARSLTPCAMR